MTTPEIPRIEVNGHPATAEDLAYPALVNHGHFTAMQVRNGRTRGLDLHLARLKAATRELYDTDLDGDRVRDHVRHALGEDVRDASVRVMVFWPDGADGTTVMVAVRPPAEAADVPQRLRSVAYQRPLAHIKHLGGFGQIHFGRSVRRDGFDEALLTGPGGVISEGAVTNLGCYDGTSVRWPNAPCLAGITMQLLERHLPALGVPSRRAPVRLADLPAFDTVFIANSRGIAPVSQVDDLSLPVDADFMKTVTEAYESVPWDPI